MKIKLFQGKKNKPFVVLDTAKIHSGPLYVNAKTWYRATAILEDAENEAWETCDYVLQAGSDPDVFATLEDELENELEVDRRFKYHKKANFPLFEGMLGRSSLYLFKEDISGGGIEKFLLAEVDVANEDKKKSYTKMVCQLLENKMPQYVVTAFKWQMAYHKFDLEWEDGSATYVDVPMMIKALEILEKDLKSRLSLIRSRPYEQIRAEIGFDYPCKLKKLDMISRRSLVKNQGLNGARERKVLTRKKVVSFNCTVHDVIKTFLLELEIRSRTIHEILQREINEVTITRNNFASGHWKLKCKHAITGFEHYQKRAKRLERIFNQLQDMTFLKSSCKRMTIFDVDGSSFMINYAYYDLYKVMRIFADRYFSWHKDRDLPWKKRPNLSGPYGKFQQGQFKYSIVYENWCIAQLCQTLEALGYTLEVHEFDQLKESYCYTFSNEEVEITLWHGIVARPKENLFQYETGKNEQRTPDFALSISKKEIQRDVWIVGDVKSSEEWNKNTKKPYDKYGNILKKGKDEQWNSPFAILVLWFGKKEASIQFPRPESSANYKWDKDNGIILTIKEALDYVKKFEGAMSMNVDSENLRDNLKELMEGLIKTGLHKLEGKSVVREC